MNNTKEKAIERLQRAHDDLKRCPFRTTMSKTDLLEYLIQVRELSDAWADLAWRTPMSDGEQKKFRSFCGWVHDFNSVLINIGLRKANLNKVIYWVPYFEIMLNITHVFLDTGNMDVFYNAYIHSKSGKKGYKNTGERWCLITSDMCGIDSPYLPCYIPTTLPMCTDAEEVKNYFLKLKYYGWKNDADEEQRIKDYHKWENEVKPILDWVNDNLVSKAAKDDGDTSQVWFSDLKF